MAVSHASVSVAQVAISLTSGVVDADIVSGNPTDVTRRVTLTNEGANVVNIGGPGVTTSAYGAKLAANAVLTLELGQDDELYAIAATGTNVVRVLHVGV